MTNKKISKNDLIKLVIKIGNDLGRKPKKRDSQRLYYYSKKYFGSWNNLMKATGYKVRHYQKINSITLNEDFSYFLGLLITDGHIHVNKISKRYKVTIYTSYEDEKRMIINLIKSLFNYTPGVSSRMYGFNKKPNYEIRIASKNLTDILINKYGIPQGAKSLIVRIPKIIFESPIKIKMAFLRGVIDGDGGIGKGEVTISSGSRKFLVDLILLLKELDIDCRNIYERNYSKTLELRITKKENLMKLKQIYNTDKYVYARKKEKIDKI